MTTLNKYHPTGRLYTSTELAVRRHKLTPKYIHRHPMPIGSKMLQAPMRPYCQHRNANKRLHRRIAGVRK